jgi:hypothetical protein
MSTHELERLLESALHETDQVPVDVPGARAELRRHVAARRTARRRLAALTAAVAVLVAAVTVPLVLSTRDDAEERVPLRPPPSQVQLSPSGLPVGLLKSLVEVGPAGDLSLQTLRLLIRPDGTGQYKLFDYDVSGADDSPDPFRVRLLSAGPGRAKIEFGGSACLTLAFSVSGRRVTFDSAAAQAGCFISPQTAAALVGHSIVLQPLPADGSLG